MTQLNPLDWKVPISDKFGQPTPEFQRKWAQQSKINGTIPTDASAFLDTLGATPGDVLLRGATLWALAAPSALLGVGSALKWTTARTLTFTGDTTGTITVDGSAAVSAALTGVRAAKWTTARTLSFTGDVTGSGSVDGSADVATALTLANTAVAAGTYGDATHVAQITVDAKGRLTAAAAVAISGGGGGKPATIGFRQPSSSVGVGVSNIILVQLIAEVACTLTDVNFMATAASATSQWQAAVYADNASGVGSPSGQSLLARAASGTVGIVRGLNSAALSTPLALTKGEIVWIGFSLTVAAFNIFLNAASHAGFASNGGTLAPPSTAPTFSTASGYMIWGDIT